MSINILESIDKSALGLRLQDARKQAGLTQEEAAKSIGIARTTLVAIEKGERKLKPAELLLMSRSYGRDVSDLLRNASHETSYKSAKIKIQPFSIQFRAALRRSPSALEEQDPENQQILKVIAQFESLCQKYQELEKLVPFPLSQQESPEYSETTLLSIERTAEHIAQEERKRLGLGDGPIPFLRDILEQYVGIRIFYIPMPPHIAEMYVYDECLGGCMAINSNHPEERRHWSMAHGYLHFLAHRRKPVLDFNPEKAKYQRMPSSEQLAEAFPAYFLMPTHGVFKQFREITQQNGKFTPTHLFTLAHYYRVSLSALALRLEQLELLRTGTWNRLKERGLKVRETQQALGLSDVEHYAEMVPAHYQHLAIQALKQDLITEGHFADYLGLDRLEARRIADKLYQKDSEDLLLQPLGLDLRTV